MKGSVTISLEDFEALKEAERMADSVISESILFMGKYLKETTEASRFNIDSYIRIGDTKRASKEEAIFKQELNITSRVINHYKSNFKIEKLDK